LKLKQQISSLRFVFSRWTRLSYAVFQSIGVSVQIAHLQFDLHKIIFQQKSKLDHQNTFIESLLNQKEALFLEMFLLTNQKSEDSNHVIINYNI
jgi:hypothetical protein